MFFSPGTITIDDISHFYDKNIQVFVLRLDKVHPVISGNKWFKLKYYLDEAKTLNKKNIITFGGAWSNHIVATAAAAHISDLNAVGLIRGEEPVTPSATLIQAKEWGMKLVFMSRTDYQREYIPPEFTTTDDYIIPEGGYGTLGAKGAASILDHAGKDFTHCLCACGTGTMLAGLINAAGPGKTVTGISVLKNNHDLQKDVESLLLPHSHNGVSSTVKRDQPHSEQPAWQLIHDYHFGGYAKHQPALLAFMNDFYRTTHIPSDFVYTGKLFYAVTDLISKNFFTPDSRLLLVHSGGLQGNRSLSKGTLIF